MTLIDVDSADVLPVAARARSSDRFACAIDVSSVARLAAIVRWACASAALAFVTAAACWRASSAAVA